MHILLVAATEAELAPFTHWLSQTWDSSPDGFFRKGEISLEVQISGIGAVPTTWTVATAVARRRPDLAINAGIAGALDTQLEIGTVVNIVSERFSDLGIEQADGLFTDVFKSGLADPDLPPFKGGLLLHPNAQAMRFLPSASGSTVNKVHGSADTIALFKANYPGAQVESMEGAAFFYACLMAGISFLEIRAISNYVEKRNRSNWNIPLAIEQLNKVLIEIVG